MTTPAISTKPPWLRVWTQPRITVREQITRGPGAAVWILPILSGIAQTLVRASSNNVGLRAPIGFILALAFPIGVAWGLVQLYLLAGLLFVIGQWTDERATFTHLRIALAWAAVPQVLLLLVWLLGTAVAGRFLYIQELDRVAAAGAGSASIITFGLVSLLTVVCALWWFVLTVFGVAEAQGGSAWRALCTLILSAIMIGVAVAVLVLLIIAISRG